MLKKRIYALGVLSCLLNVSSVWATWSIVVFDTQTQEVGIASATCISNEQLPGIDLRALSPIMLVAQGGGAAQSAQDSTAQRRNIIRDGILNGIDSESIVDQLVTLSNTGAHQHGIVGAGASSATHTGNTNFVHASGVANNVGNLQYAIQGNVLAGRPVVTMTEQTLLNTSGDLADRLMAAMETAREFGGDGRCSCPAGPNADSCGSPPASFDKSAHVGFLMLSRFGDEDDAVCNTGGCADGDYYLDINIAAQPAAALDPVIQLRSEFDTQRAALIDRPDAVQSSVTFTPVSEGYLLTLELRDHTGQALIMGVDNVAIVHAADSGGNTSIGAVENNDDGSYSSVLTVNDMSGDDVFLITIEDSERTITVPPNQAILRFETFFRSGFEALN